MKKQKRCLKCEGCRVYQQQWAAFGAAKSESDDPDAIEAAWNAYKQDNAEDIRCTDPRT